jgi:thioesterase domain-containing protein
MTALQTEFGRPLSPGLLIEHPTARSLAARLATEDNPSSVTFLPLRRGHPVRPPVYLLPPWNQSCTLFRDLARTTPAPTSGAWFGVEATVAPGQPDPDSIEAIAAQLLPALIARHPDTPFVLAGFSAGGFVAWELGRQLEAAGRKDIRIVLLDCPRIHAWLDAAAAKATAMDHRPIAKMRNLTAHIFRPRGLHRSDMIVELLLGKLSWWLYRRRRYNRRPPDPYAEAFAHNIKISQNYRVPALHLPVGVLRSRYQADWTARFQCDLGWSPYCLGPLMLREIKRGHIKMLFAPAAHHTARLIEDLSCSPSESCGPTPHPVRISS